VPIYFFNIRCAHGYDGLAVDPEGKEFPDLSAVHAYALEEAREMMAGPRLSSVPDWFACSFEISDAFGQLLLTVPFADVLSKEDRDRRIKILQAKPGAA
jgi:hypothetical protein